MGSRAAKVVAIVVAVLATLLLAGRLAAPWGIEHFVNAKLAAIENYRGEVGDIDLGVIGGRITARDFKLERLRSGEHTFITTSRIELDLRWPTLLRGHPVIDVDVREPSLNLVRHPDEAQRQLGQDLRWSEVLQDLPFTVGDFAASGASVNVYGLGIDEPLPFYDVELHVRGFDTERARLELHARALDGARLEASGDFDPSVTDPAFDVDVEVSELEAASLNPWLAKTAKLSAMSGELHADASAQMPDDRLTGFVEVEVRDASLTRPSEVEKGPLQALRGLVANFALEILQGGDETWHKRVELDADVDLPDERNLKGTLAALLTAFREALKAGVPLLGGGKE